MMLNTQQASIWATIKWLIYIDNRGGGGVCIFIYKSMNFKEKKDLSISKYEYFYRNY